MNEKIAGELKERFAGASFVEFRNDLTVIIKKADIVAACSFLKDDPDLRFDMIIDLCGVDLYTPENRFEVIYNLYSTANKQYLRLKVPVDESDCVVPTVSGIWS